ncbi:hypothetical protein PBR_0227 [Segatella baroniae B14]|uniref:Uncharacterized protein n=1 Tax=Segatella baroniae B14 TaxID=752555 RepID=D8E0A7_9BACT|nr:hypothetical protein PBR_0227 [Segatella baroniae B14]
MQMIIHFIHCKVAIVVHSISIGCYGHCEQNHYCCQSIDEQRLRIESLSYQPPKKMFLVSFHINNSCKVR